MVPYFKKQMYGSQWGETSTFLTQAVAENGNTQVRYLKFVLKDRY